MSTTGEAPEMTIDPYDLYGYIPTTWVCIVFLSIFAVSSIAHTAQAVRARMWWLIPTATFCGVVEVIGWSGRLWSSYNTLIDTPFLIQICALIIAPTFLLAAIFTAFGLIITKLGFQYSWLTPRWYLIVFLFLDISALVVQSVGGALASSGETQEESAQGARIMMGGIILQLAGIIIFSVFEADFLYRYLWNRPVPLQRSNVVEGEKAAEPHRGVLDNRLKQVLFGMCFTTLWLVIRSIYRVIELSEGWDGPIITNELLFNVLDGVAIAVSMLTMNVFSPARLLTDLPVSSSATLSAA